MKCCSCNKEIDISKNVLVNGEASWYGKYQMDIYLKVICHDCIKDPKKKAKYTNDQDT